jgi:hypothetical protein
MRAIMRSGLAWLLWCGSAAAQSPGIYVFTPLGYQQISSPAVATNLTLPTGVGPVKIAEICVETQGVRYRDDGVAPTAAIGIPVAAGSCFAYSVNLSVVQFIQQVSGAVIDVSYYR